MRKPLLVVGVMMAAAASFWLLNRYFTSTPPEIPHEPQEADVWFEDVAEKAGIDFTHFDPRTPEHLIPETMGSGVGWIDYDADGWPDLFCIQDGSIPPAKLTNPPTHKLYRNNRNGTFTDVTQAVGLNVSGFGVGCAVGDYDNDGFDDLVITLLDGIVLYHNQPDPTAPGGRRFIDVTVKSKLRNTDWGTSCAWGDLDGDGFLDLYVCNYVVFDPANPKTCTHPDKKLRYQCSPTVFAYSHHRLFRNNRDGTFTDVSRDSGIQAPVPAPGLGVVIVDVDGDGKPDIYVANDMNPAYLFRNLGGMKFQEIALRSGAALGPGGSRMSGMGVEAADMHGEGHIDLFVTNFQSVPNVLFRNRGQLRFEDASYSTGLGGPSVSKLGFGTCTLDADLDGNIDLATANGHVDRYAKELFGVPYPQECQLFLNDGEGKFRDVSATAGKDFLKPRVGRGLARADFDRDGKPDLVVSGVGERVALLQNRMAIKHGWVCLELIGNGKTSNKNAIGAVIRVEWGGKVRHHVVSGGGSYLSASDRHLILGLGEAGKVDKITVRWPSGTTQEYRDLPARTRWKWHEGKSTPEPVELPGK